MFRSSFIKAAGKDYPGDDIKKGESYWKWKFHGIHRTKTEPEVFIKQVIRLLSSIIRSGFIREYPFERV